MIKMIKMKLKNKYYVSSLLVLYVCYWPGLEDCSSGPGIVSRSLSRGGFVSLSSGQDKKNWIDFGTVQVHALRGIRYIVTAAHKGGIPDVSTWVNP